MRTELQGEEHKSVQLKYLPWLVALLLMFVFRVLAQLIQLFCALPFLPAFDAWQSGALPYRWLFCSQILIVIVLCVVIRGFRNRTVLPSYKQGKYLIAFGSIYFAVMVIRLVAGFTVATQHPWFGARIPAVFHLVLASFVLVVGHYHFRFGLRSNNASHNDKSEI